MSGMRFTSDETLTDWLLTSVRGHMIVREILTSRDGEKFWPVVVERLAHETRNGAVAILPQPTLALVEIDPKYPATVKVYGEKHLRAKIIERPIVHNPRFPAFQNKAEILVEEMMHLSLPQNYREIYADARCLRATETLRHESVKQLAAREAMTRFEMEVISGLNSMVTK